ncbi:hypothetical protein GCM10025868_01320 [Angustibacter aerolatus]|uniref:Uncharacterized protein n=1 Tax=Angustibacter aerolatus TaxID=1162965 RepID=A0ABQ6J9N6_9ACTN|nr:hypothetical protein [Angustibacter aerolatus]GMA84882.1 hypothetical protein GCM10025868_01320 [Angustibacter aerolatus]
MSLFNSTGTADVVVRALPGVLSDEQRERLVGRGISVGAHVLPGTTLLIGGARGGLLLRRVLGLLGAADGEARDRLDAAALQVGALPPGLEVSGAGPTGDDVVLRVRDDADPAAVWAAATRYTAAATGEPARPRAPGRTRPPTSRRERRLDADGQRARGQVRRDRPPRVLGRRRTRRPRRRRPGGAGGRCRRRRPRRKPPLEGAA